MSVLKGSVQFKPRPSNERGGADHGWLKTLHTFSFAGYRDPAHSSFGCLRVINEDRVAPHTGFGTHSHSEFEIFSYVVSGELQHNDSMGNTEVLKRGDLQMTSAGTGIQHSEHAHGERPVHFLQIWAKPSQGGLTPAYYTRHFTDEQKKDTWAAIVAPASSPSASDAREAAGPAPVHALLSLYATLLSPAHTLQHTLQAASAPRRAYVHVIQTSGYNTGKPVGATVKVSAEGAEDVVLREGDGMYVVGAPGAVLNVGNVGEGVAEVLLFEME